MKNEVKHRAHSSYRCEYHIVFAPKYRRKEIYGQLKKEIGKILRKLYNEKKLEIIEAEACPDHIHMLVSIPPYLSISQCSALFGNWGHPNRFGLGTLSIAEDAEMRICWKVATGPCPSWIIVMRIRRRLGSSIPRSCLMERIFSTLDALPSMELTTSTMPTVRPLDELKISGVWRRERK